MTSPTDKPSIAELQALNAEAGEPDWIHAPVLLEIVAAALEWSATESGTIACMDAYSKFRTALAKVRP